jgi:hypothetical protein
MLTVVLCILWLPTYALWSYCFKAYVCFYFQNLSIYFQYMYYYWPIRQIIFWPKWPNMSASFTGHIWPETWKLLSQKPPDMFAPWPKHIWLTGHIWLPSRTYPALGLKGIKRASHTPLNPTLSFALHFNSLGLQWLIKRFGISSTEFLWFLGDLPTLPFVIFKP